MIAEDLPDERREQGTLPRKERDAEEREMARVVIRLRVAARRDSTLEREHAKSDIENRAQPQKHHDSPIRRHNASEPGPRARESTRAGKAYRPTLDLRTCRVRAFPHGAHFTCRDNKRTCSPAWTSPAPRRLACALSPWSADAEPSLSPSAPGGKDQPRFAAPRSVSAHRWPHQPAVAQPLARTASKVAKTREYAGALR